MQTNPVIFFLEKMLKFFVCASQSDHHIYCRFTIMREIQKQKCYKFVKVFSFKN